MSILTFFVNFSLLALFIFIFHSPVFFFKKKKKEEKSSQRSVTDISEWNRECKISVWPWHCSCWNINGIKCRWIGNVCSGQRFLQALFLELTRSPCLCCRQGVSALTQMKSDRGDEDDGYCKSLSLIVKAACLLRLNRQCGLFRQRKITLGKRIS